MEVLSWILIKVGETAAGKFIADYLEKNFPKIFKNKNKEIIKTYESRIKEKNAKIKKLEKKEQESTAKFEKERGRLIGSLKRRSIATEKLLEQYHRPLNAILISYASQQVNIGGKIKKTSFLREELSKFNSKYLGGTDVLIPPSSVPQKIKTQQDLKKWFEEEILKGRYCKVKFLILFDLKKDAFWKTYLPYVQKKPMHLSIGDMLGIEDLFTDRQISLLSISEIIKSGDIAWLASSVVSEGELEIILRNQKEIETLLDNPSLRILSNRSIKKKLSKILSKFIEDSDTVAEAIIDEAKFWQEKIKG